ncbi:MAG: glycosyltransferase family 2 protein [Vampirovibrionales bacterium]|nr:glycosyltransferase family 2 protein [Vampirovibrionales bacterium]
MTTAQTSGTQTHRVSILIPVFNERLWLPKMLEKLQHPALRATYASLNWVLELIIIDDGSSDGTRQWLETWTPTQDPQRVRAIYLPKNMGKGAAIRAGLKLATGDVIAIQDADLEYDPADYPPLIQLVMDGYADAVYGTRLVPGKPVRAFNIWHYWGNQFLSLATNVLFNTTLTDMETGCKIFRADLLKSLPLRAHRFEFEPEVTALLLKRGARLYEAPISYHGRNFDEGKKIRWVDGFWALWTLLKCRL